MFPPLPLFNTCSSRRSKLTVLPPPPSAGSVFHSIWQDSPAEWTNSQLAKQVELLRSVTSIANRALEKARIAKKIRSSLEAKLTILTDSETILSTLHDLTGPEPDTDGIELSLADYFIVSEASAQSGGTSPGVGDFKEEGTVKWTMEGEEKELDVQVVAMPISGRGKCPRCWKWVCPEHEDRAGELCDRCKMVEDIPNVMKTSA